MMMNTETQTAEVEMTQTEMKTFDVSDNSLRSRFLVAFNNRPDWAQSFTTSMIGANRVRVTYSSSTSFGVDLQAAWNYIERH